MNRGCFRARPGTPPDTGDFNLMEECHYSPECSPASVRNEARDVAWQSAGTLFRRVTPPRPQQIAPCDLREDIYGHLVRLPQLHGSLSSI